MRAPLGVVGVDRARREGEAAGDFARRADGRGAFEFTEDALDRGEAPHALAPQRDSGSFTVERPLSCERAVRELCLQFRQGRSRWRSHD